MKGWREGYPWDIFLMAALALLALISRYLLLEGKRVSGDEFLYAIHLQEILRIIRGESPFAMEDIFLPHPLTVLLAIPVHLALGGDALLLGRALQALLNALCVPATYLLARVLRLRRRVALWAGLIVCFIPIFWLNSGRFWPDSQLTLLSILFIMAFMLAVKRNGWFYWIASGLLLTMAFLTKEHISLFLIMSTIPVLVLAIVRGELSGSTAVKGMVILLGIHFLVLIPPIYGRVVPKSPFVNRILGIIPTPEQLAVLHKLDAEEAAIKFKEPYPLRYMHKLVAEGMNMRMLKGELSKKHMIPSILSLSLVGTIFILMGSFKDLRGRGPLNIIFLTVSLSIYIYFLLHLHKGLWPYFVALPLGVLYLLISWKGSIKFLWDWAGISSLAVLVDGLFLLSGLMDVHIRGGRFFFPTFPAIVIFASIGLNGLLDLAAGTLRWITPHARWHPPFRGFDLMGALLGTILLIALFLGSPRLVTIFKEGMRSFPTSKEPYLHHDRYVPGPRIFRYLFQCLKGRVREEDVILTRIPRQMAWISGTGLRGLRDSIYLPRNLKDRRQLLRDEALLGRVNLIVVDFFPQEKTRRRRALKALRDDLRWLRSRPSLRELCRLVGTKYRFYIFRRIQGD